MPAAALFSLVALLIPDVNGQQASNVRSESQPSLTTSTAPREPKSDADAARVRRVEAGQQEEEAEGQIALAPGPLQELARENAKLAAERFDVAGRIEAGIVRERDTRNAVSEIDADLTKIQDRVNTPGMESYVGPLLTHQRRQLPKAATLVRNIRTTRGEATSIQVRLFSLEEKRDRLKDIKTRVAEFLNRPDTRGPGIDRAVIELKAPGIFAAQLAMVESLLKDYKVLWIRLTTLNVQERQLLSKTEAFLRFIDERVLWLPSGRPLYETNLPRRVAPAPDTWHVIGEALRDDITGRPVPYLVLVLGLGMWVVLYPRAKARERAIQELVGHAYTDSFVLTLQALVLSVYVALPGLVLPWFVSSRMSAAVSPNSADTYEFAQAFSVALRFVCPSLFLFLFFRHVFQPRGVAEAHFQWDLILVRVFRRDLTWLMCILIPVIFVAKLAGEHPDEASYASVGRIAFIFAMLSLSLFFARVLHPVRGAFPSRNVHAGASRLLTPRQWVYVLSITIPIALAVAAAGTYPHTAGELSLRLFRTLWLVFCLMVVRSTVVRFALVSQSRLAVEQARRQQQQDGQCTQEAAAAEEASRTSDESIPSTETITYEARTLLRWLLGLGLIVGVWGIWQDLTPAFSFMNRVELWSYSISAGGQGAPQGGAAVGHRVVYLSDLVFALITATATGVLVRHGPAILQIVLLSRLPIDPAARFAATTIVRYVIVIVGVAMSFNAIGIGWSRVQWLAAAITVGLGFGLQEIFANFVSGLIVLFERPVRIGDIVTVGGIDGTITRIRMRATTVTDFNRRELIVPNKEFITGQIVNWTLSDPVTRVVVPVGIAYGSDTRLARNLLLKTAKECPHVMDDPAPAALFKGFGNSTLDFELRVFIPNRDVWADMIHELHTRIDDEFRRAGIEIAFPQQDVHIRSVPKGLSVGDGEQISGSSLKPERKAGDE